VLCGLGGIKAIQAFNPQPDPGVFGLAGMNPGDEFMRLNVSNLAIRGLSFGGKYLLRCAPVTATTAAILI
jgi:hypothetical protein